MSKHDQEGQWASDFMTTREKGDSAGRHDQLLTKTCLERKKLLRLIVRFSRPFPKSYRKALP